MLCSFSRGRIIDLLFEKTPSNKDKIVIETKLFPLMTKGHCCSVFLNSIQNMDFFSNVFGNRKVLIDH